MYQFLFINITEEDTSISYNSALLLSNIATDGNCLFNLTQEKARKFICANEWVPFVQEALLKSECPEQILRFLINVSRNSHI